MKSLLLPALFTVLATFATAQSSWVVQVPGASNGRPHTVGNITNPGFAHRLGSTVNGSGLNGSFGVNGHQGNHRRSVAVYPYFYPVYVPGYANDYGQQPSEPAAPATPVVINQNFYGTTPNQPQAAAEERDAINTYVAPSRTPEDSAVNAGKYYLIAYKDHSVFSALAYWMEDKTLHYVTTQNSHNQVSLALVDVDLTKRLNQARELPFNLDAH